MALACRNLCPWAVTLTGLLSPPAVVGHGGQSWLGLGVSLLPGHLGSDQTPGGEAQYFFLFCVILRVIELCFISK